MTKPNIWIIDDCFCEDLDNERKRVINTLESSEIFTVTKSSPDDYQNFRNILAEKKDYTDLVLIDFKFDKGDRNFDVGSELSSKVRHICYDTPIYLLSAYIPRSSQYGRVQGFERTIGDDFISKLNLVEAEALSFKSIKEAIESKDKNKFLSLLVCPEQISDDVFSSMPLPVMKQFFGRSMNSNSDSDPLPIKDTVSIGPRVEFFRWFIERFYRYPGFLLDAVSCAQMLGISLKYFESDVLERLDECRYKGLFYEGFEPRFWKTLVEDLLIDLDQDNVIDGRRLLPESYSIVLGAQDEHKSRCVICENLWPDALAQDPNDISSECHPVHIRCTEAEVDTTIGPYFLKPRMLP